MNRKKCIISFPSPPTGYVHSYWCIICLCNSLTSITNCDPAAPLYPLGMFNPSHFLAITPGPRSASKPEPGHALLVVHAGSAHLSTFWHLGWRQDSSGCPRLPRCATVSHSHSAPPAPSIHMLRSAPCLLLLWGTTTLSARPAAQEGKVCSNALSCWGCNSSHLMPALERSEI